MTPAQIIQAAIPDADAATVEYVLWNRTPFPFRVDAREIYQAAARFARCGKNGKRLCELCDRLAVENWLCAKCSSVLHTFAEQAGSK